MVKAEGLNHDRTVGQVHLPPASGWGFCSIRSRPVRAANRSIVAPSAHCGAQRS